MNKFSRQNLSHSQNFSLLQFILVVVWSSALFELGWMVFIDAIGVSLFIISATTLVSIIFFSLLACPKKLVLRTVTLDSGLLGVTVLYISYSALTLIWTPSIQEGKMATLELAWYFAVLLFSVAAFSWVDESKRKNTVRAIGYVSLVFLFSGIAFSYISQDGDGADYSFSLFKDYNIFNQALLLSASAVFVDIQRKKSFIPIATYIFFAVLILAIGVSSGSRRAIMLYGPIFIFFPLFLSIVRCDIKFTAKFCSAIFLLGVLITAFAMGTDIGSKISVDSAPRLERAFGFITGEYDQNNRVSRWESSLELYGEYSVGEKFFGQGMRAYLADERFIRQDGSADSPHNFLLTALLEGGVFKVFILITILVLMAIKLFYVVSKYDFWFANFILVNFMIWFVSVSISAQGFFDGKIIFIIFFFLLAKSNRVFIAKSFK